jgi:hypothetical protein
VEGEEEGERKFKVWSFIERFWRRGWRGRGMFFFFLSFPFHFFLVERKNENLGQRE